MDLNEHGRARILVVIVTVLAVVGALLVNSAKAVPVTTVQRITLFAAAPATAQPLGTTFDQTIPVAVSANGKNTFSLGGLGPPKGTSPWQVDDQLVLDVTRPDGSVVTLFNDMSDDACTALEPPLGPTDLTSFFQPGDNSVRVRIINDCLTDSGSATGLYLVYRNVTQ